MGPYQIYVLKDRVWQPLPGDDTTDIYPLIRKPDVTCSNSFMLRTNRELILIDIGGTDAQAEEIRSLLAEEGDLPLYILLTHSHGDHCFPILTTDVNPFHRPFILIAHREGAAALETADESLILADLFGKEIHPVRVPIHLFETEDLDARGARRFHCEESASISICLEKYESDEGHELVRERLVMPSGLVLAVYPTPGHSPDSVCITAGDCFFSGDLFFATAPGVAGLSGFNHQELQKSIRDVCECIRKEKVSLCCSAHGDPVPAGLAVRLLAGLEKECGGLATLSKFDRDRMDVSRAHAEEILDEACRLFSVIAGRILSVCYHLEEIGEGDEADRIRTLLDIEALETLLDELLEFHAAFRAGEKHDIQFILKAVQMLGKFTKVLAKSKINAIIDISLVNRATRFFEEFMLSVHGKPLEARQVVVDLNEFLISLVREYRAPLCTDEDFLDAADDEGLFLDAIVRRLSDYDRFVADISRLETKSCPIPVSIDRHFLTDVVLWILEDLTLAGYHPLALSTDADEHEGELAITGYHDTGNPSFCSESRWWSWERKVLYSGGELHPPDWDATRTKIVISLKRA